MAKATETRLVTNESSFEVVSESHIVILAILLKSYFIEVDRWMKTFGLGSIYNEIHIYTGSSKSFVGFS